MAKSVEKEQLLFEYHLIDEGTEIQVIADDMKNPPKQIQINNIQGDLYEGSEIGESSVLVWIDDSNRIAFSISSKKSKKRLRNTVRKRLLSAY